MLRFSTERTGCRFVGVCRDACAADTGAGAGVGVGAAGASVGADEDVAASDDDDAASDARGRLRGGNLRGGAACDCSDRRSWSSWKLAMTAAGRSWALIGVPCLGMAPASFCQTSAIEHSSTTKLSEKRALFSYGY